MGNIPIKAALQNVGKWFSNHAPVILQSVGIAGMISTTVVAVAVTPKAMKELEAKAKEKGAELTFGEKIKIAGKYYIPVFVAGGASIVCLILALSNSSKRESAALATAYFSETALAEYKNEVAKLLGEQKEAEIRDKIVQEKAVLCAEPRLAPTNPGDFECFEPITGRKFISNANNIDAAVNRINNAILTGEDFATLNDWYYEIGLDGTESFNKSCGWFPGNLLKIHYTWIGDESHPTLAIVYDNEPKMFYTRA